MFGKKKQQAVKPIPEGAEPVLHSSICTGETAAGFLMPDGKFMEILLIESSSDIEAFKAQYGITGELRRTY